MLDVLLTPVDRKVDIQVISSHVKFGFPQKVAHSIEKNWELHYRKNENLFRGQLFHISEYDVSRFLIKCTAVDSDYAHYLATLHKVIPRKFFCRSLHVSIALITSDGYSIFGKMGRETSTPWQIHCAGGGVTSKYFSACVNFDILDPVSEELREELYLDINNPGHVSSLKPVFFKTGGMVGNIGILFEARTPLSWEEVSEIHAIGSREEKERGIFPEFCELVPVLNTSQDTQNFLKNNQFPLADYMPVFMKKLAYSEYD